MGAMRESMAHVAIEGGAANHRDRQITAHIKTAIIQNKY